MQGRCHPVRAALGVFERTDGELERTQPSRVRSGEGLAFGVPPLLLSLPTISTGYWPGDARRRARHRQLGASLIVSAYPRRRFQQVMTRAIYNCG